MFRKFKVFHYAVDTPLTTIVQTQDFASLQGNEPTPSPSQEGKEHTPNPLSRGEYKSPLSGGDLGVGKKEKSLGFAF